MGNITYACINTELRKKNIFTGRTCRRDKFQKMGLQYVGELGLQNLRDLLEILKWNEKNNIKMFRIGSDIFPWSSEYEYIDLPQYREVCELLTSIGKYAKEVAQRLTFHPGPFNILGSKHKGVVARTAVDLRHHSEIFDMMGFTPSPYNKINIHIGAAYKDKHAVLREWCRNYTNLLDSGTKARITLENDDRASLYTVEELYDEVYQNVGVPIVFDVHHWNCHHQHQDHNAGSSNSRIQSSLQKAISTWPAGITPIIHYSSSKRTHEDPTAKIQAHADWIYIEQQQQQKNEETIIDLQWLVDSKEVDIVMEAKKKECAVMKLRDQLSKAG